MSPNEENHSSVISFNIKGIHPHDVASMLDFKGVCVHFGDGAKNVHFHNNQKKQYHDIFKTKPAVRL